MSKFFQRRACLVAVAAALCGAAVAADYPDKPIRLVVPYPAGGSMDMVGRLVGKHLGDALGQPVVVDNKPGASGNIGMDFVAKAPKDGYTLMIAPAGLAAHEHFFAQLPFAPLKDFTPITRIANQPNVLIVSANVQARNINELIAYAKQHPNKLTVGTSGVGTSHDVAARAFMRATGTEMLLVPYKGGAPALADLLGGQIDVMFDSSPTAAPYVQSGKLRALGTTDDKRLGTLPAVPTMAEAGVAGFKYVTWMGVAAPAGVPDAVTARLARELQKLVASPAFRKQIVEMSLDPAGGTPSEFRDFVKKESDAYARFVKDNNIAPQ